MFMKQDFSLLQTDILDLGSKFLVLAAINYN